MRTVITSIAAAVTLIAAPAFAESKPGVAAPAASSTESRAAPRDQRYCVEGKTTGSRIAKRTCKTRAEWLRDEAFDPLNPAQ